MLPIIPAAVFAAKTAAVATLSAYEYFALGAMVAEAVKNKKSVKKILKGVR